MELTRADAVVQFTPGGAATWNNVNVPVPAGVVVIDTVSKVVKEGDGATLFANLPVCLDYNFGDSTSGANNLVGDDVGKIVIADDSMYAPSTQKLSDIMSSIAAKAAKQTAQQDAYNTLATGNKVLAVAEGTIDGTIVVCDGNGKYGPGDKTLAQLISDLILDAGTVTSTMHIDDLVWYIDSGLQHPVVTPNEISERNTYWCKVSGFHDTAELRAVDFGLSTQTNGITITTSAKEETCGIITAVYGGSAGDQFSAVAVDSSNNIICVGSTDSEGTGGDALVVKFASDLSIIARKRYGASSNDQFIAVAVDSSNNIICAGYTASEGTNGEALVVKFASDLSIIARKRYGGSGSDNFYSVAVDSSNNIICTGFTTSEGTGGDALVIKFASDLSIIARKRYGSANDDYFYSVVVDSSNNIICVGSTASEGANEALVVKFSSDLSTMIARKRYGGASGDQFNAVTVDSSNNIICAGSTNSEGSGNDDALVVKFASDLTIIARKRYGGSGSDLFYDVTADSSNNIICAGSTNSEGAGGTDALVVKFSSDLSTMIARKRYGGASTDIIRSVVADSSNNIICAGSTGSEGAGSNDALVVKFASNIPSGTITGTVLTGLTLADSTLTLADSALTLADSTLTLTDSTLTLTDSALTLADSTLTLEKDILVAARYTVPTKLITTIYTSSDDDRFTATILDNVGNIIAVGATYLNSAPTALVVKFDANFTPIARKLYTGNFSGIFNSLAVDASNNIIGIGSYTTTSGGYAECFIVKFDPTLSSVIAHKTYGASGDDMFNDIILDPSGKYLCVGYTTSEGSGLKDGLVIKFNTDLSIAAKKRYGGSGNDVLNSIAIDTVGNAICVGWTGSEGANASGLILKLDANLNIVIRKIYNSTIGTTTEFSSVAVTPANVVYCAGRVVMASGNKGLIVKFDSNINTTANKLYGSTLGHTEFTGIGKDSTDNIICVGKTSAEGAGNFDAVVLKLSAAMAILGRKTYGTVGIDANIDCTITGDDDIIMSGYSVIDGSIDAVLSKMPASLPAGIYTNKYFTDLILSDSKLILSDDTANLSNSTLTMADSTLVLTNGTMTLSNAEGAIATDTTIMDAVSNVFKVEIGDVVTSGESVTPVFNVVTNDGDVAVGKNISVNVKSSGIIAAIYGGSGNEIFYGVAVDSDNNIICAGYTNTEGSGGGADALVVKFASDLSIIARKRYGGTLHDQFLAVAVDSSDNIICVGHDGTNNYDALVVKFASDLSIIARKRYGGSSVDEFYGVAVDSSDNIICAGYSVSEGTGNSDALVVKFASDLSIVARKRYSGAVIDIFYGITVDSNNNIICVGYTQSEGAGSQDALVVKFASDLSIVARKRYGGSASDIFQAVAVDSSNNIICAGYTNSSSSGSRQFLIVKFVHDLSSIAALKTYDGSGDDWFFGVTVNHSDDIIGVGYTSSEGINYASGYDDAIVMKFDNNLNLISRKRYGGSSSDQFKSVAVDNGNNIICVGHTLSEGNLPTSTSDALIIKFTSELPSGIITGTTLTGLTLNDSSIAAGITTTMTLADSTLTLADSILTLADSTLTLADSTLTLEKDILVV